jgi:diguanylate cyclase (GGDEF)-like protein
VPTFESSHLIIDLATLCAVTGFVTVTGGLLLLFAWAQNRNVPALAFWGSGYLVGSVGAVLLTLHDSVPDAWSVAGANALMCCAYGLMWGGARCFEGRNVRPPLVLAGAAVWLAACPLANFYDSPQARVDLISLILAVYVLLGAREIWHARDRELISRWPTLVLLVIHAGFLLARIPLAGVMMAAAAGGKSHSTIVLVMAFEALFTIFSLAFLRVSMAKERAELEQRKTALTDSLTGIANRRAFFEFGEPLLQWTLADRRPAALLLFDLDRFKEVNDAGGHPYGDRVLRVFTDLVTVAMRPGDLFARIGGEEFACLLPDASMAESLQFAERVRCEIAAMPFPGLAAPVTVSVGVAMASEPARNLLTLLATADRALYRAKAGGRNCVAPAPLILVETNDGDAARPASTVGLASAVVAPMAG